MVKVYIASSLKNYSINFRIAKILESIGIHCFLPQRDALESTLKKEKENNHVLSRKIKDENVKGIKNADIVLIVARNLGSDTAWESGFATALKKRTVLLKTPNDKIEEVYMLYNSVDRVVEIKSFATNELNNVFSEIFREQGDKK